MPRLNRDMPFPGPESHPPFKHRMLPKEVQAAFGKFLAGKTPDALSVAIAANETVRQFVPASGYCNAVSDPVTAISLERGNCRARAKIVSALAAPYRYVASLVMVDRTPLEGATHVTSVLTDSGMPFLVKVDPGMEGFGLDEITFLSPGNSWHAKHLKAVGVDPRQVSVEFHERGNMAGGTVKHAFFTAEDAIQGALQEDGSLEVASLIACGPLAEDIMGVKGLSRILLR